MTPAGSGFNVSIVNFMGLTTGSTTLVGQGYPSTNTLLLQGSTQLGAGPATNNEIDFAVSYTSSTGLGTSVPTSSNKVAGYFGIQANAGSGNVWALNPLLYITAGALPYGGGQIAEFDLAQYSGQNYGDTAGAAGTVQPAVFGMQITGAGTNRATTAIGVLGTITGGTPLWNRGITFYASSIAQSAIEDYSSATTSYYVAGSHSVGIDMNAGTFSTAFIRGTGFAIDSTGKLNLSTNNAIKFTSQTSGAAAAAGTLTNAPSAGNPNFWLPVTINGTTRYVPAW